MTDFSGTNVSANGTDIFLCKYDSAGNLLWVRKAGGNNTIYGDGAFGLALDPGGNPCVGGYFSGTANFGSTNLATTGFDDIFAAKYDPSGKVLWARKAGGSNLDIAYALAADSAGNLFLTGFFSDAAVFGTASLTASGASPARDVFVTDLGWSPPIRLSFNWSGANLRIAWPAIAADFRLESTTNLSTPSWTTIDTPTNIMGVSRVVTVTNPGSRVFCRLQK